MPVKVKVKIKVIFKKKTPCHCQGCSKIKLKLSSKNHLVIVQSVVGASDHVTALAALLLSLPGGGLSWGWFSKSIKQH